MGRSQSVQKKTRQVKVQFRSSRQLKIKTRRAFCMPPRDTLVCLRLRVKRFTVFREHIFNEIFTPAFISTNPSVPLCTHRLAPIPSQLRFTSKSLIIAPFNRTLSIWQPTLNQQNTAKRRRTGANHGYVAKNFSRNRRRSRHGGGHRRK